ncbi:MAG: glycosyltransferase [Chloroflexi bacterium]|nr:glycosyltransferase [Chloroflexota bacterium]
MYIVQMIDALVTGGAQQLLVTFAKEVSKRGHKLAVISLAVEDSSPYPMQLRALGVDVYFFPTTRVFNLDNLRSIIQWLRAENPDLIHTHLTYANVIGAIVAALTCTPIIATLHNIGVEEKFHAPRTEFLELLALRYVMSKVIACGPAVAQHARMNITNKPILVIPNAIEYVDWSLDPQIRATIRKQIVGDANRVIIISVGRLLPQKGFEDLIDAFAILHQSHPQAFLVIAGDGDLRGMLEEKINNLRLSEHARLLGRRSDIPNLLAASDVFTLASHWEGLPIAVLEAMTAGLPIVATDVGDNAWAIGSAGMVVPPHQPEVLARTLSALLDDPAQCESLGRAARVRIKETFDPTNWCDQFFAVYREVLH